MENNMYKYVQTSYSIDGIKLRKPSSYFEESVWVVFFYTNRFIFKQLHFPLKYFRGNMKEKYIRGKRSKNIGKKLLF